MNPVRDSMYFVYVLRFKDSGLFYTGCTKDLQKRLGEHGKGRSGYTKNQGTFEIIYYEACIDKNDAFAREKYLKTGMGKRYIKNRNKRFLSLTG